MGACVLTSGCAKRSGPKPLPAQASARPAPAAGVGLTPELEALISASRSPLTPEQRRARLEQVLAKFPAEHSKEREELIVQAVARGAYDPPRWTTITSNYKGRRAQIQVSADALTILGVRIDVTAEGAQRIADALGTVLPTPRILQLIWEQAEVRIEPCTSNPDAKMASTARMLEHSECVDQRIAGKPGMVANEGKHWVLSNRIAGKQNLAANYGWFMKGRRPIQTVGTRHDTAHTDYSQIVRLVKPTVRVDGREVDIRNVGRSPELAGLVSDEGPLFVWRAAEPDAAPKGKETSVASSPPAAPGDPALVRVTLAEKGPPVRAESLPASTTALRRNTLSRRIQASLRLRATDIPDAAYLSAAAAACGGRDVFFELMNDVPVELAELEANKAVLQRALACGKSLTDQVRAGATLYQVEYEYEGMPSGFALLTLPDDSLRDRLVYAPLSPTPAGVHRAYCSDDTGGPRSVCEGGAGARLLLAVNRGYVAASGPEVPSLLARLATPAPPPANLAALAAAFAEPAEEEEVALAMGGHCGFAVDFAFVDLSPDETNRERVLDAINDHALWCGTRASGSLLDATRRLVFLGKDEAAARAIQAALKQRSLEVSVEAGTALKKGSPQQRFTDAMRSAAGRAARSAKIERGGARLSLALNLEPSDEELKAMAGLLDARAERAKQAAEIVRGLAAGTLPTAAALASFRADATSMN